MTIADFFGCTFLAFGLPFAMFVFTIAHDPIRIIILIAAAFFWLLSLLISSILWFALVPIRNVLPFAIFYTVIFQEVFRFVIYKILRKAENGLQKITDNGATLIENKDILSYVSGLGFGLMSGAFSIINILADSIGPGTMGFKSGNESFFLSSSCLCLSFILLNTFWNVIFFKACDTKNYFHLGYVIFSHLLASYLTLINRVSTWGCILSVYTILMITGSIAFKVAGGSLSSIKNCFSFN